MPLIPINTDAPLYHFPYATIGLIFANVVCFAATGFALKPDRLEPWLLQYGEGLNPLEWIPAAFAHGGFMHLIGNMFFLWGFGLVVEGKLGWKRFIPLYFAMAAAWGAGVARAGSEEFDHEAGEKRFEPVVYHLKEWVQGNHMVSRKADDDKGGTMRLGAYTAQLAAGSKVAGIYGATTIEERHRHRYEVDIKYRERLEKCGLIFSGMSPDGRLPEIVEVKDHPWFIGVQFHPELKSKPFAPHPLFADFIRAAKDTERLV